MRALRFRHVAASAALVLCGLSTSCASHWYDHRFYPAPIEAQVAADSVSASQVRALATVIGIERGKDGAKDAAIVRMRLENIGSAPATFEAEQSSLVTADLKSFEAPVVTPAGKNGIAPGATGEYDLSFRLPEGKRPWDLDLSGLNLRFTVAFGEKKVTTGMTFQRVDWNYYEPGYPRVHVGFGVGWYHCN